MKPKISIIVPVYNTKKEYLDDCVESLMKQTLAEIEIILVDDGSEPDCSQLCDSYGEKDARIYVIHQQNQGVSAARNHGIAKANGQWIMFVDADDWIELNTCEALMKHLNGYSGDIMMFNAINEYPGKQRVLHFDMEDGCVYDMADTQTRELLYRRIMRPKRTEGERVSSLFYCWDKVYKREFLLKNDLQFSVGLPKSEDKVFVLTCAEKMDKLYYIDDAFYHYRINQESVCHKYSQRADEDRRKLAKALYEIALRMDKELAERTSNREYDLITKDYYRFLFGIISDVLLLKYFHKDNPDDKRVRYAAAREFVKSEPFSTAIRECKYSQLPAEAKLKKLLLTNGLVWEFFAIFRLNKKVKEQALRGPRALNKTSR